MKYLLKKSVIFILTFEAKWALRKHNSRVIAITGSVGKTSTKEAVFSILSPRYSTWKSEKSFNSEIGLPLSILGLPNEWGSASGWLKNIIKGIAVIFTRSYPEWLVLEVGADRPGDIAKVASWLKPDIVIITRIGDVPVHVEFFPSPLQLAEEKGKLIGALKTDGVLIVNADDEKVKNLAARFKGRIILYGFSQKAAIIASNNHILYDGDKPRGVTAKIDYNKKSIPLRLKNSFGKQSIYGAMAALAVALAENINLVEASRNLESVGAGAGRLRLIKGMNDSLILDDSYNSSPAALEAALETLEEIEVKGRKMAALGDMMELGVYAAEAHRKIGRKAAKICDSLILVGVQGKNIVLGAKEEGTGDDKIKLFERSDEAGRYLKSIIRAGDIVLIKGSQSMRMERAVIEVMAEPELAPDLLVRQELEWQKR